MQNQNAKITINFWLFMIAFALILGSASLGVLYLTRVNYIIKVEIAKNKEAERPANIDAIAINDKNCPECFDVTLILTNLTKANVNLTSSRTIDQTDAEAKDLIAKYAIEKLPTIILRGELQKNANLATAFSQAGTISGDTFVLRQVGGPYVNVATGKIKGKTELTLINDSACANCYDVNQHQTILYRFGLNPKTKVVDVKSPEGQSLINKYGISLAPTFVLTGEVKEYETLLKIWPQVGIVKNNAYIFTLGVPAMGIYRNLTTNKIINPAIAANTANNTVIK